LRIDGNNRPGAVSGRAGVRAGGTGPAFALEGGRAAPMAANSGAAAGVTGLGALLALQAVQDPQLARKKAVRRGRGLLDALNAMRTDLLAGPVGDSHINQMLAALGQAREQSQPELDALIDDIELRARVELAKLGHFPSA